jgi:hypothetical protein
MNEDDFEGTLILEQLAEIGQVDAFFEAIDSDNFSEVRRIMLDAGVDPETIKIVMKKVIEGDGET